MEMHWIKMFMSFRFHIKIRNGGVNILDIYIE